MKRLFLTSASGGKKIGILLLVKYSAIDNGVSEGGLL
jgi:hypothetical protein